MNGNVTHQKQQRTTLNKNKIERQNERMKLGSVKGKPAPTLNKKKKERKK